MRYDDSDGPSTTDIANLSPDVILATSSGITEQEYEKLSKIASVVAYPEASWVTPWQTTLETVGKALGRSDEAKKVVDEPEANIDAAKGARPSICDEHYVATRGGRARRANRTRVRPGPGGRLGAGPRSGGG